MFIHKIENAGCIRATGKDVLDLIHRLSTNDVKSLSTGSVQETIFTTEKARIIDIVLLVVRNDDVLILTSPNKNNEVLRWIDKYTIMDDVKLEDVTFQYHRIDLFGDDVHKRALKFLDSEEQQSWRWKSFDCENEEWFSISHESVCAPALTILFQGSDEKIFSTLNRLIQTHDKFIDDEEFQLWRIMNGYPRVGFELNDKTNPLESGADKAVSFTKGCYIGQEVIARLDTYHKVQRHLRGLIFHDHIEEVIPSGTELLLNVEDAGIITSTIFQPEIQKTIGLGLIRNAFEKSGQQLRCSFNGKNLEATVSSLPFDFRGLNV